MVDLSLLRNPIILGIIAAVITYLYMWWDEKKRREKNPKSKQRSVNIITPGVVGVISWFVASSYFEKASTQLDSNIEEVNMSPIKNSLINGGSKNYLVNSKGSINSEGSLGSASYHIIGKKNIRLPPTDVFIDLAKF